MRVPSCIQCWYHDASRLSSSAPLRADGIFLDLLDSGLLHQLRRLLCRRMFYCRVPYQHFPPVMYPLDVPRFFDRTSSPTRLRVKFAFAGNAVCIPFEISPELFPFAEAILVRFLMARFFFSSICIYCSTSPRNSLRIFAGVCISINPDRREPVPLCRPGTARRRGLRCFLPDRVLRD